MALSSHATTAAAAVGTFHQSTRSSSRRLPASSVSPRPPPPPRSLRLDHAAAPSLSPAATIPAPDGLLAAAIEHLEREPASVAADEAPLAALSPRELQLVLVYFAQEGRDAYCALDWLRCANRVDGKTMELMSAIACGRIERLVGAGGDVADIAALLGEMDCVGLRPGFSLVEKAVALYWDRGETELAVEFVRDVLRRGGDGARCRVRPETAPTTPLSPDARSAEPRQSNSCPRERQHGKLAAASTRNRALRVAPWKGRNESRTDRRLTLVSVTSRSSIRPLTSRSRTFGSSFALAADAKAAAATPSPWPPAQYPFSLTLLLLASGVSPGTESPPRTSAHLRRFSFPARLGSSATAMAASMASPRIRRLRLHLQREREIAAHGTPPPAPRCSARPCARAGDPRAALPSPAVRVPSRGELFGSSSGRRRAACGGVAPGGGSAGPTPRADGTARWRRGPEGALSAHGGDQPAALIRAVAAGPEWRARGGVLTPAWPSSVAAVATWPERWLRRRSVPGASTPTTCRTGCTPLRCSTRCRGGEKSVVRLPNFSGG